MRISSRRSIAANGTDRACATIRSCYSPSRDALKNQGPAQRTTAITCAHALFTRDSHIVPQAPALNGGECSYAGPSRADTDTRLRDLGDHGLSARRGLGALA